MIREVIFHTSSALKSLQTEAAQDLAEYGIALAVISAVVGLIALAIAADVNAIWAAAQAQLAAAV